MGSLNGGGQQNACQTHDRQKIEPIRRPVSNVRHSLAASDLDAAGTRLALRSEIWLILAPGEGAASYRSMDLARVWGERHFGGKFRTAPKSREAAPE